MKNLILAAALAAIIPALSTAASAHRPTPSDNPAPVKLDTKDFFEQLQRQGR